MLDPFTKKILKHKDKYVIFYSEWCSYSMRALKLLQSKGVPYRAYVIEKVSPDFSVMLMLLNKSKEKNGFRSGHTTRPIIFKHGKFLGGYTELAKDLE